MTGYDIHLTNNDLLTAINVKTIDDRSHSSLVLIGQGIPNYGTDIAQDFVWLMENFSNGTAPVHPLVGQEWHDSVKNVMNYYGADQLWHPLLSLFNSFGGSFDMAVASQNVDFTVAANTTIFTASDLTRRYLGSFLVLVPRGAITATTGPTFNLSASTSGDILSSTALAAGATNQFARLPLNTLPRIVDSTHPSISLNITVAATGGAMHYDVYVFGFVV